MNGTSSSIQMTQISWTIEYYFFCNTMADVIMMFRTNTAYELTHFESKMYSQPVLFHFF